MWATGTEVNIMVEKALERTHNKYVPVSNSKFRGENFKSEGKEKDSDAAAESS